MFPVIFYDIMILASGYVVPAYNSYKAVKNKDTREYTRLMMYWVVFAAFVTVTTFTDLFVFWLPLYYELKLSAVLWMSSPYTQGSTVIYRRLVHPELLRREHQIEGTLERARAEGWRVMLEMWTVARRMLLEGLAAIVNSGAQQQGFQSLLAPSPPAAAAPVIQEQQPPVLPDFQPEFSEEEDEEDMEDEDEFVHIGNFSIGGATDDQSSLDLTESVPPPQSSDSKGSTRRSARLAAKRT